MKIYVFGTQSRPKEAKNYPKWYPKTMKIDETATLNPFKPQAVKSYWGRPVSRRRRSQSGRPLSAVLK